MTISIKHPEADALAKDTGEPLLFKGDDFSLTDIEAVAFLVATGH